MPDTDDLHEMRMQIGGTNGKPNIRVTIGVIAIAQVIVGTIGFGIVVGAFRSQMEVHSADVLQLKTDVRNIREVDNRQSDKQLHRLEVLMEESRSELMHLRTIVEDQLLKERVDRDAR